VSLLKLCFLVRTVRAFANIIGPRFCNHIHILWYHFFLHLFLYHVPGSVIKHQLVTHLSLGIALRYVLDALRKPADSKVCVVLNSEFL